MDKRVKIIMALCLSAMIVFAFAGCGSEDSENQNQEQQQTEQQQATENNSQQEQQTKVDYSKYIGKYEDQKSHRAMMEIKENTSGDGVLIHIHWGSSSTEDEEWDMTGTLEGNRLVYKDCVKKHHVYDSETGKLTVDEVIKIDPTGFFDIVDSTLKWTGSPEAECQLCAFEKL